MSSSQRRILIRSSIAVMSVAACLSSVLIVNTTGAEAAVAQGDVPGVASDQAAGSLATQGWFANTAECVPWTQKSVVAINSDGATSEPRDGDGLGRQYTFVSSTGIDVTQILPPPSWRPLHATDAQLALYGFQPRPTDPALMADWEKAATAFRSAGDPGYCSTKLKDNVNTPRAPGITPTVTPGN